MKTYLQAFDLWEVVNFDVEPEPLRANPTVAQIRQHADERTKRHKAMSCIQNSVSDVIFTRIMACETPKQAWDKLKEEFQGTERTRQQQLLNLMREFENLKMKEEESVKQYSDRIMAMVNSIRLLGEQFSEAGIVEKVISTLPERYEVKISSLEDLRDLTSIPLTELINAFYAQEQRRASRLEEHQEGIARGLVIQKKNVGSIQMLYASIAKRRVMLKESAKARPNQAVQERLSSGWLLDSGCTNHMTPDAAIFKSLDRSCRTKIKIGNGHFIQAEGKGDKPAQYSSTAGERGYSVMFKDNQCQISDPSGSKLMAVPMTDKSFVVDWTIESDTAYAATTVESKLWH
ncbi:uncharacterized protein LOC128042557 [Gossypium raimondii]|uniref:uncharacterized protein LOC128042557 n=1 Tax=Gossypium raimondii TaxID=29730 RepID=UPI00227BDEC5|nr:uncharacterized protein LOC128042557 [Gossypium raimondii]